jgi:hypothetical protein
LRGGLVADTVDDEVLVVVGLETPELLRVDKGVDEEVDETDGA